MEGQCKYNVRTSIAETLNTFVFVLSGAVKKYCIFSPFLHQFSLPVGVSEHFWDEKWWPWPKKLWSSYSTWIVGMSRYPVFCLTPLHCKDMAAQTIALFFWKNNAKFSIRGLTSFKSVNSTPLWFSALLLTDWLTNIGNLKRPNHSESRPRPGQPVELPISMLLKPKCDQTLRGTSAGL